MSNNGVAIKNRWADPEYKARLRKSMKEAAHRRWGSTPDNPRTPRKVQSLQFITNSSGVRFKLKPLEAFSKQYGIPLEVALEMTKYEKAKIRHPKKFEFQKTHGVSQKTLDKYNRLFGLSTEQYLAMTIPQRKALLRTAKING